MEAQLTALPILPPEIIDKIMVYYTHMLPVWRPKFVIELEIFLNCRKLPHDYDYMKMTFDVYINVPKFREYLHMNFQKYQPADESERDRQKMICEIELNDFIEKEEFQDLLMERAISLMNECLKMEKIMQTNERFQTFNRERENMFRCLNRLKNHQIRMQINDELIDPICEEFPFYNELYL